MSLPDVPSPPSCSGKSQELGKLLFIAGQIVFLILSLHVCTGGIAQLLQL